MKRIALLSLLLAVPLAAQQPAPNQERDFLSRIRRLTVEGKRAGEGYWSPDGSRIVFQSEREAGNPFYQIYTLNLATGDSQRISPGMGKTTCSFFRPGSDEIEFASTHADPKSKQWQDEELAFRASGKERRYSWDYDPEMDIYSYNEKTKALKRLTTARGYDAEGSYSPDGQWLVFSSMRDAYNRTLDAREKKLLEENPSYFAEIYIMRPDGSGQKRLTTAPGYDGGPFFTHDGSHIVWRRFDEQGLIADVWTMKLDGSEQRQITDFGSMSWAPYEHPSGRYFIFSSNKLGFENFELFMVDKDGTKEPVRVTYSDGFDGLPVPSPDGKTLAWTSSRSGGSAGQLFLAQWNHEKALEALEHAPAKKASKKAMRYQHDKGTQRPRKPQRISGSAITACSALIVWAALASASIQTLTAQQPPTRQHVQTLASEKLDGRLTGSPGEALAAEYIESQLQRIGAKPVPGLSGFRVPFEYTAGNRDGGSSISMQWQKNGLKEGFVTGLPADVRANVQARAGNAGVMVRALSFSDNGDVEGPVVFAGYGIVVPDSQDFGYDSYATLDVKDKVVLVLRYFPEDADQKTKGILARYSDLRYKAMAARQHGAKAILVVTGPRSPNAGEIAPMTFDTAIAGSGIVAASITGDVANRMFAGATIDTTLDASQKSLDSGNPHVAGFALTGVTATVHTAVVREKQEGHNIVAYLPATTPTPGVAKPWIALGAHFDHLGHGTGGNSLARKDEAGRAHLGADDNASGTSAVLAVGELLAKQPRRRNVLLGFWSGEELGLLGSAAFAAKPPVALPQLSAYLNFDMVGRMQDNRLAVQALGSSSAWSRILEQANVAAGFDLQLQPDPYQPTDVATFNQAEVPSLNFFTGTHTDYHRPTDTADKIDYEDLDRIVSFAAAIARRLDALDEPPAFTKFDQPTQAGSRAGVRVFTGTIPDYTSDVKGLLLGGVVGGGPAEQAGLQKGDVIVEIAGQTIANIYDYTYALDLLKIGQPVKVAYMRAGKRVDTELTPAARK